MNKLVRLLPFMDGQELKDLAMKIINGEVKGVNLSVLFPFLRSSDLTEISELLLEKKDVRNLKRLVPFARQETIEKIYQQVKGGNLEGFNEVYLYPFLGKDMIKSMFNDLVKEAAEHPERFKDDDEDDEDDFDDEE